MGKLTVTIKESVLLKTYAGFTTWVYFMICLRTLLVLTFVGFLFMLCERKDMVSAMKIESKKDDKDWILKKRWGKITTTGARTLWVAGFNWSVTTVSRPDLIKFGGIWFSKSNRSVISYFLSSLCNVLYDVQETEKFSLHMKSSNMFQILSIPKWSLFWA